MSHVSRFWVCPRCQPNWGQTRTLAVCDRVTALMPANRTRTVTVRPARCLAPQAAGDAIRQVTQHRSQQIVVGLAPTKRGLRANRAGPPIGLHFAVVLVGGQRANLAAECGPEELFE